jgi:(p)ppGpp synthase/HD superfamily hydrolase
MEVMTAVATRGDVSNPDLAVQCALLHDVVEDAGVSLAEVAEHFGGPVAAGVGALTKNDRLATKEEQMQDSLERIRQQPHEVWMVKLADRITNLQPPPQHWAPAKIRAYHAEARQIHAELALGCPILAERLAGKIDRYLKHA